MITELELKNFRGFGELKLGPLKRVNLISGKNNTGKTGMLEALYLAYAAEKQLRGLSKAFRRDDEASDEEYWDWLLRNGREDLVTIRSRSGAADNECYIGNDALLPPELPQIFRSGKVCVKANNRKRGDVVAVVSTLPTTQKEDAADVTSLNNKKQRRRVETMLREIDPRLQEVQVNADERNGRARVFVDIDGIPNTVPLNFLGQGFGRLLRTYSKVLAQDAKIILIDEIENGIHHSAMRTVWDGLALAARELDVQIFATTHSMECIVAAHEAFQATESYDLSLLRLERHGEAVRCVSVSEEGIEVARELEFEVR